ncbi:TraR/DksA family transcriptional regulator [Actinomadura macrotermitis]|uniref:RNA polymerase-binding transcription factor DksA n=1 Tax=Actinomadura macrotermitis TaxID=2585200 RepID=A0A7K0C3Z6_9ACTN|nr:TraR/DksA C4-type zinc finger protein [Actinomadura macrotermitis]MQY07822.1 RNA polymerase-binding transcription factor DksA [Actinomadura macrotermitis]
MSTNLARTQDATAREVRQRLEQERQTRASQLAVLEQAAGRAPQGWAEESDHTRMDNLRQSLAEIDAALQRLRDGTYGGCEGCGKAIPEGRLEILPYVRFCVKCQARAGRPGR